MPQMSARGLVLVRIGTGHRVADWLAVPRELRNWDLALSLYEDVDLGVSAQAVVLHRYRGGKWDGIHAFFAAHPDLLAAYDYFWLVDDDIEASPQEVDALFDYVRVNDFELAQPALTLDSYYSHRLTLQCPGFLHRYTNFVEIMAPLLSRSMLERVLPLFAATMSGLGIDWYWNQLAEHPERGIAIIDAVPVGHRRPLRQHLRSRMREYGVCPYSERKRLAQEHKLIWLYPVAFSGVLADGSQVSSRPKMARLMTQAYWRGRGRITRRPWWLLEFPAFLLMQLIFQAIYPRLGARR